MKLIRFLIIFLFMTTIQAQSFDAALQDAAQVAAEKLNHLPVKSLAVYPFYNQHKKHTDLSRLISEDFSVYLNKYNKNFKIIERNYLEQMMQEHQLNEEGLIDPRTAKEFGMIIAADVYVTGKIMVFTTYVRLLIFAIDTQTGERVYSDYKRIPIDKDIAEFLGIKDFDQRKKQEELYKSSNDDCHRLNVGDFCFVNKSNDTYTIRIYDIKMEHIKYMPHYRQISVNPHAKQCFKDLPANKSYKYLARKQRRYLGDIDPQGEFFVKKCTSDYIIIH